MRFIQFLALTVTIVILSSEARGGFAAGPALDPANSHYYARVDIPNAAIDWTDARDQAASLTYLGRPGHLATVTSADESDFIAQHLLANLPNDNTSWIGAFQPAASPEPTGGFKWVTGEPFVYTNWAPGEPNNQSLPNENSVQFYTQGSLTQKWNDIPNQDPTFTRGFLVEFEPSPTAIPLPPALVPGLATLLALFIAYTLPIRARR
jgi:hypothetical protein